MCWEAHRSHTGKFEDRLRSSDAKMKQRIEASKQAQASREAQECTFQPTLRTRSQSSGRQRDSRASTPVHERLSQDADEAKKRKEDLRIKQEADSLRNLTFKPTLVAASKRRTPAKEQRASDGSGAEGAGGGNEGGEAAPAKSVAHDHKAVHDRLSSAALEYERKREAARERQLLAESAELTFQPQLVKSPLGAKYTASMITPPSTKDEQGNTSPTTVFDRLQYAAMLKRKNDEALKKKSAAEYSFQPQLNRRAKSAPKRRPAEDASTPIHERLIKAGERRKSVLIDLARSKEREELANCTFAPSLPAESEAIVLHIIREEEGGEETSASGSEGPMLRRTPPVRRSTFVSPSRRPSATYLSFGAGVSDTRVNAWHTMSPPSPGHGGGALEDPPSSPTGLGAGKEGGEGEDAQHVMRRAARTRRGSVFDRLNAPKSTPAVSESSDGLSMDVTGSSVDGESRSVSPSKRTAPIRRSSMLLKPTLASALKDRHEDYDAVVRATASLVGLEWSDHTPKLDASFAQRIDEEAEAAVAVTVASGGGTGDGATSGLSTGKPKRRDSVMMPTASSALKASPQSKRCVGKQHKS